MKTNKSVLQGFTNIFDHFAECLRREMIPTQQVVLGISGRYQSEWPLVTGSFLHRGGTVASVANMIFERAMESDELAGDGDYEASYGEQIDELVVCRNDHELGGVAGGGGGGGGGPGAGRGGGGAD